MRLLCSSLVACVLASFACGVAVQAEEPIPAAPAVVDGDEVFVSGVPDRFDEVRAAAKRARETSGRRYRVIVVGSSASTGDARTLLDRILTRWSAEAETGATAFDPAADVTILLDTDHRLLAMRVHRGWRSGVDSTRRRSRMN